MFNHYTNVLTKTTPKSGFSMVTTLIIVLGFYLILILRGPVSSTHSVLLGGPAQFLEKSKNQPKIIKLCIIFELAV